MKTKEIIIYIHGITPSPTPEIHKKNYDSFEQLLKKSLKKNRKSYPETRIDIEWGYNNPEITTGDNILADTERYLLNEVEKISDSETDITINPLRLVYENIRKNFILGFADMFYYVSEDGKQEVRRNVLKTILNELPKIADDESYSFTIISHSAGTVIIHDLLFILFGGNSDSYLATEDKEPLDILCNLARNGRVKIHGLVTFGSPITPMIVRSSNLLQKIHNGEKLDPKLIGIGRNSESNFWLNFWDKDDVISDPISFLYQNTNQLLQDVYVDVGNSFPDVHSAYWKSEEIAAAVAEKY